MIDWVPPGLILLAGAVLVAVTRGGLRNLILFGAPLITLWSIWQLPEGIAASELAAWTMVASTIYNLDITKTLD